MARKKNKFSTFWLYDLLPTTNMRGMIVDMMDCYSDQFPGLRKIKKVNNPQFTRAMRGIVKHIPTDEILVKVTVSGKVKTEIIFDFYRLTSLKEIEGSGAVAHFHKFIYD